MMTYHKNIWVFLIITVLLFSGCTKEEDLFNELKSDRMDKINSLSLGITNPYDTVITAPLFSFKDLMAQDNYVRTGTVYNTATNVNGNHLQSNSIVDIIETTDYVYISTSSSGIWIYNKNTNTGQSITIATTITGDDLPSNLCRELFLFNNSLFVATNAGGLWIYDLTTFTGQVINSATIVLGDALPSNFLHSVLVDANYIYIGINTGIPLTKYLWIYNKNTNTGLSVNSSLPSFAGQNITEVYVNSNSIYYSSWDGIAVYNTISLSNLPLLINRQVYDICFNNNIIYAAMANYGVWVYNTITLTSYYINTSTTVIGDKLQSNNCNAIRFSNGYLFVGNDLGYWEYNIGANTGKVWNTTNSILPNNYVSAIFIGTSLNIATFGGAYLSNYPYVKPIITSSGNYTGFIRDLSNTTYHFNRIKLIFNNQSDFLQVYQTFKTTHSDTYGYTSSEINILNIWASARNKSYILDVPLDCIIGMNDYLEFDLLANINFRAIFYWDNKVSAKDFFESKEDLNYNNFIQEEIEEQPIEIENEIQIQQTEIKQGFGIGKTSLVLILIATGTYLTYKFFKA